MAVKATVYFVVIPIDGRDYRWPKDGPPLMTYRQHSNAAIGWVAQADSPEDAARQFRDSLLAWPERDFELEQLGTIAHVATCVSVGDVTF